ncbi:MAG: BMP family ABC transporter substrate-binding protein [Treponema sp.]|uniref:BMP family lipoprotein n=1 Tax=Treponema sp. TaxID=166 RepID=UPI001B6890CE|nr:BMP family ABC transporter substrate-binding protein [Treponema sp.]MBP5401536.1 BMP family ABC transporter substrate-binding protein [Treponema sp.]MBR5932920.1 BMP family ABC transporter substrate-binding protein [Treponema sp.]
MKKKFLIIFLLFLSSALIFSKGGSKEHVITVKLITDETGIDDKSFNAAAWRGILDYYNDTWNNQKNRGKYYDVITCRNQEQALEILKKVSQEGIDLIIATGFNFAESISNVAELYPEQKFVIIDTNSVNKPNVMQFIFHEEEGSYLVGVAAALQAKEEGNKNPKFGFIGGIPGGTITKFEMGYIQGIKSVFPNAEIVDFYVNGWNKKIIAKEQARKMYDSGVYAIFCAAGESGTGVIQEAKERQLRGVKVWAIGVDSDQYVEGIYSGTKSAVLTSMIKGVDQASKTALMYVEQKSFIKGTVVLSLKEKGVDFAKSNPDLKPSVIKQTEKIKQDISSGKIKIYSTYSTARRAGIAPAGLGAKDN